MKDGEPRERRKKSTYEPTIEIPPDFDPVSGSLVEALLKREGLPIGNTLKGVKPDSTSIGDTDKGTRKGGNKHVRKY